MIEGSAACRRLMHTVAGVWLAAFLPLSFPAVAADESSPVAKPEVKEGDRWTYRRTNHLLNRVVFTRQDRVVSTGPDEILVVSRQGANESDAFFTSQWGSIVIGGTTFIPRAEFFKFPLAVGAAYNTEYETANKGSRARSRFEFAVKVVGWEDVEVPAGKFRALKLEANGNYVRIDPGARFGGMARFRFWYVPEIKRWAKTTYEEGSRGLGYPDTSYTDELVGRSVQ